MFVPKKRRSGNIDKTLLYDEFSHWPPLVQKAVDLAKAAGFSHSCTPEQGQLLALLAAGRDGGMIGETGTGFGVGLAWMAAACSQETTIISVEKDEGQVEICRELFSKFPNVTIIQGDWRRIEEFAPYDLLVLDGGGGGKRLNEDPPDPLKLLNRSGNIVLDDFHPAIECWPPEGESEKSSRQRGLDQARDYWFNHPEMLTTEFRLHPLASSIIGMRK